MIVLWLVLVAVCWVFCGQCDEEVPWDQYRHKAGLRQSAHSLNFLVAWGESRPQHEKLIIEISSERGLWLQLWVLASCLVAWPTFLFVSLTDLTRRHLMSHPYCSLALLSPYHLTGFFPSLSYVVCYWGQFAVMSVGIHPEPRPTQTHFPTPLKNKNKKTMSLPCVHYCQNVGVGEILDDLLVHSGIETVTC